MKELQKKTARRLITASVVPLAVLPVVAPYIPYILVLIYDSLVLAVPVLVIILITVNWSKAVVGDDRSASGYDWVALVDALVYIGLAILLVFAVVPARLTTVERARDLSTAAKDRLVVSHVMNCLSSAAAGSPRTYPSTWSDFKDRYRECGQMLSDELPKGNWPPQSDGFMYGGDTISVTGEPQWVVLLKHNMEAGQSIIGWSDGTTQIVNDSEIANKLADEWQARQKAGLSMPPWKSR